MSSARIILKARRARPFFGMHPWVYAGAIDAIEGDPRDGDIVDLHSSAGNFIARGLYNSQSKIRVRLYAWDANQPLDADFFRGRLEDAIRLRRDLLGLMGPGCACRLVFSEADGLSGLTVDRFDRWLVVQFTSLALASPRLTGEEGPGVRGKSSPRPAGGEGLGVRGELLADLLTDLLQPAGIYLRTERGIGQLEGLQLQDGPLRGNLPDGPIEIVEHGLRLRVDLAQGQKTGYYLDQRDNRLAIARLAAGRRMLDAFCYSGGFGLHAAKAGAAAVLGVDASEPALELARGNAQLNGLTNIAFEKADVFGCLDRLAAASERFGVIVLDPPKFARSGSAVEEALRGYRRLLAQSLKLLEPGGILAMCCCSGLISREMLHDLLAQESSQARRLLQILASCGPSPDHPVLASCPETSYLKCVICRG